MRNSAEVKVGLVPAMNSFCKLFSSRSGLLDMVFLASTTPTSCSHTT